MISNAIATDLLACVTAHREKSVPLAAGFGGVGLRDGRGIPAGIAVAMAAPRQWALQPAAIVDRCTPNVDVPGPPPRGVPV